jgi:hypothetical protein
MSRKQPNVAVIRGFGAMVAHLLAPSQEPVPVQTPAIRTLGELIDTLRYSERQPQREPQSPAPPPGA